MNTPSRGIVCVTSFIYLRISAFNDNNLVFSNRYSCLFTFSCFLIDILNIKCLTSLSSMAFNSSTPFKQNTHTLTILNFTVVFCMKLKCVDCFKIRVLNKRRFIINDL